MSKQHITAVFEHQADVGGDRVAVRTLSHSLTYRQLNERANGIAMELRRVGAGPDTRVALLTDQEPRGCSAIIGILKSGATCVPISRTEPTDRIRHIVEDSGARVVVSHDRYLARLEAHTAAGLTILDLDDIGVAADRSFQLPDLNHLTFILYTSGSTGRPKGVLQTNTASSFKMGAWQQSLGVTPNDRVTLFATFATGQGSTTTLLALLSGATLCPFDVREDGMARFSQWLGDFGVTIYGSSSTLFRSLVGQLDERVDYPDLRLIRLGGERVTPQDVELARRHFPAADLVQSYSATETGNIAAYRVPKEMRFSENQIVPVGLPRDEVHVHILAEDGHDAPPGSIGEIVVRSPHLSPGYWNDPDRTAQVFRPLPTLPNDAVCRIGDRGRIRPDGLLEHHGRRDFRVKIRGFRIELEEVEAAIETHPNISRVAAAAVPQSNRVDLTLAAYIQTTTDARMTPDTLRRYLGERLPDHMVPSLFIFLDELPLTPSGKVNRKALPYPSDGPTRSAEFVVPRSPLEIAIAEVWKAVLQLDTIGVDDHFLEIGGDSLRATQVATRLRDDLHLEITMRDMFEAATVAELASLVEQARTK